MAAPTYSLTLRGDLGRKLTIEEMDDNFRYLDTGGSGGSGPQGATGTQGINGSQGPQGFQGPSGGGGGGSSNVDLNQISFGGPIGLTSSQVFTINTSNTTLSFGNTHTILATSSSNMVIMGGHCNSITNAPSNYSCDSAILGGHFNSIYRSKDSTIIGGYSNSITTQSHNSSIIGSNNILSASQGTRIIGNSNSAYCAGGSFIMGCSNKTCSSNVTILGGFCNTIYCNNLATSIIGGDRNIVGFQGSQGTNYSGMLSGRLNQMNSSRYSSMIGGTCNIMCQSDCSVILGGASMSMSNMSNTVMVPKLYITGSSSVSDCGTQRFGVATFSGSITNICIVNGIIVSVS